MVLTPAAARPWLAPESRGRRWSGHGAMLVRRQEALRHLYASYGSWARLGLGALAWAMGVGGAVLAGQGVATGATGMTAAAGAGLLLVATFLGGAVVATGSALARAIAAWWTLATAVRADGGRVETTTPDPGTRRAHEATVAHDRADGARELWRMPLLPRTLAALLLTAGGLVLLARAGLGYGEASTPFAGDDVRGQWLTEVVTGVVCLLTALLTASGLRRVHRARMHRVGHDEPAEPGPGGPALTPAVGSGAIVVGGRQPQGAAHPTDLAGEPPASPGASPADGALSPTDLAGESPGAPAADGATSPTDLAGEPTASPDAPPPQSAGGGPADVAPSATAPPRVRLSDGRELGPGTTLLGRAPTPRPDEQVDALLAVADERVSKTHLTVRVGQGRVVVVDRGSTNGSVVHPPDGTSAALQPGEPTALADGAVVVLGATTLTVGEPPDDVEHTILRAPR